MVSKLLCAPYFLHFWLLRSLHVPLLFGKASVLPDSFFLKGLLWRIADGSQLRAVSRRWIPRPSSFKLLNINAPYLLMFELLILLIGKPYPGGLMF